MTKYLLCLWGVVVAVMGCGAVPAEEVVRGRLEEIHAPFGIDAETTCFDMGELYEKGYGDGLAEMIGVLVSDPAAAELTLDERTEIFEEVVGFEGLQLFAGEDETVLVGLAANRGFNSGCGSHHGAPDVVYVADAAGGVWPIGAVGRLSSGVWIDGRWVVTINKKLSSFSGPDPWVIWHIAQEGEAWERVVAFELTPEPYVWSALPLTFEEGYQTMIANLTYWQYDDPCVFSGSFQEQYDHGLWTTREVFVLRDDQYERVAFTVVEFPIYEEGTQNEVVIDDWEQFCEGVLEPVKERPS